MPNPHGSRPKKHKRTKIKKEKPEEPKKDPPPPPEIEVDPSERDLTYFIRDRVELMRQVFSILKDRELLAMAPDNLRSLKVDDLQELCLDEVLGISSKRLRSVLDGFPCPSDTDTSNDEDDDDQNIETISLDSISSAEDDILSRSEHNERKKHGRNKMKKKNKPSSTAADDSPAPKDKRSASGSAGMTVLELLELQARARAIRAQLDAVVTKVSDDDVEVDENNGENASSNGSHGDDQREGNEEEDDDDDVIQIKEEPPEVVEIQSTDDEDVTAGKPKKKDGGKDKSKKSTAVNPPPVTEHAGTSQTTHVIQNTAELNTADTNHIHMTQHQSSNASSGQPARKIKLKRNNLLVSVSNVPKSESAKDCVIVESSVSVNDVKVTRVEAEKPSDDVIIQVNVSETVDTGNKKEDVSGAVSNTLVKEADAVASKSRVPQKNSRKSIRKIKKKRVVKDKKGSDEDDELMLELSYTEQMDLLEDFDSEDDSSEHDGSLNQSSENLNESAEVVTEGNSKNEVVIKKDEAQIEDMSGAIEKEVVLTENGNKNEDLGGSLEVGCKDGNFEGSNEGNDKLGSHTLNSKVLKESEKVDVPAVEIVDSEEVAQPISKSVEDGSVIVAEKDAEGGSCVADEETPKNEPVLELLKDSQAPKSDGKEMNKKPEERKSRSKKSKKPKKTSSSRSGSVSESEDGVKKSKRGSGEKKKLQNSPKHLANSEEVRIVTNRKGLKEGDVEDNLTISDSDEAEEVVEDSGITKVSEDGDKTVENDETSGSNINDQSSGVEIRMDDVESSSNLEASKETIADDLKADKERPDVSMSEGECSYSSDGIEITENKPEVVCISDDNTGSGAESHRSRGKKRKYRKRAKRKSGDANVKSSGDETADRLDRSNSTKDSEEEESRHSSEEEIERRKAAYKTKETEVLKSEKAKECTVDELRVETDKSNEEQCAGVPENDDDCVFEISDDSSGDEVADCLSKEPTTEEIEELSRRIDTEIRREDIVLEKNVIGDIGESSKATEDPGEVVSWKDRWLDSDKVKKVLATSNLCNALRKKNKELKKKLAEGVGKIEEEEIKIDQGLVVDAVVEVPAVSEESTEDKVDEGSVDQYKTLPGLTQYVDPVKEVDEEQKKKAMTKDAKQLMKMYKKLLKLHKKEKNASAVPGEKKKKKKKDRKEKKKNKEAVEVDAAAEEKVIQENPKGVVDGSEVKLAESDNIR